MNSAYPSIYVVLAIEASEQPSNWANDKNYHRFKRIPLMKVLQSLNQNQNFLVKMIAGKKITHFIEERIGYWEQQLNLSTPVYVHHYQCHTEKEQQAMLQQAKATSKNLVYLAPYTVNPAISYHPELMPTGDIPLVWQPETSSKVSDETVYWLNYFPEQPLLSAKTFQDWISFLNLKPKDGKGGEGNQILALNAAANVEHDPALQEFVEINFNRFSSINAFFHAAEKAGRQSFKTNADHVWYGFHCQLIASHS